MMNRIFLDTSFVIALSIEDDKYHAVAKLWAEYIRQNRSILITHQGILLEIGDALSKPQWRTKAADILNFLRQDRTVEITSMTQDLIDAAFQLFISRSDKSWGMTDCISFVVMQQINLKSALTTDQHFVQSGFRALLREMPP